MSGNGGLVPKASKYASSITSLAPVSVKLPSKSDSKADNTNNFKALVHLFFQIY